jgi:hypothetical protein
MRCPRPLLSWRTLARSRSLVKRLACCSEPTTPCYLPCSERRNLPVRDSSPVNHHLLAEGLPAADESLPRLLRLLHFPPRSRRTRGAHHDSGRSAGASPAPAKSWDVPRLFSVLGDKPELLFPEMRDTLRHLGYKSTLHYLEGMCELVLRETSLLPHPNPGLLSAEWIARLARVSPSMGLMLETTNRAAARPRRGPRQCSRQGSGNKRLRVPSKTLESRRKFPSPRAC